MRSQSLNLAHRWNLVTAHGLVCGGRQHLDSLAVRTNQKESGMSDQDLALLKLRSYARGRSGRRSTSGSSPTRCNGWRTRPGRTPWCARRRRCWPRVSIRPLAAATLIPRASDNHRYAAGRGDAAAGMMFLIRI